MKQIAGQVNKQAANYGIEVVDVRIKRADLPQENLANVYERMKADRVREATELRAQGEAEKNRIRADADRAGDGHQGRGDARSPTRSAATARPSATASLPSLRQGSGFLPLLSLDAGLRRRR